MSKEFDDQLAAIMGGAAVPEKPGAVDRLMAGIKDDIQGFKDIPAGVAYLAKPTITGHPEQYPEIAKQVIKGTKEHYGKYLTDPIGHTLDNPLDTAFDAATLWSLGLGTAGKVAAKGAASAAARGAVKEAASLGAKAAKLEKMSTPSGLLSLGKESLIAKADRDLAAGLLRPEDMSIGGKVGLHVKNLGYQGDFSKLLNSHNMGRSQVFGDTADDIHDFFKDFTAEDQLKIAQYRQVPKNRLDPALVAEVENTPRLKAASDLVEQLAKKQELAEGLSPELARSRELKPIAYADVRNALGDAEFEKLRQFEPERLDGLVKGQMSKIAQTEDISNLKYIMHRDELSELRGRDYYMGKVPKDLNMLRKDITPDYMKKFGGGKEVPVDIEKSLLTREILSKGHELNKQLSDQIVGQFSQGIKKPGQVLPPHLIGYNPTLDQNWLRFTKRTYDYMAKRPQGLAAGEISGVVDGVFAGLKEMVESGWSDRGFVKLMADMQYLDSKTPGLFGKMAKVTKKGGDAGDAIEQIFQAANRKDFEGAKFALNKLAADNPTHIIPRAVKQVMDKSAGYEETSKILKALWDQPTNVWRKAVLGLSPRWPIYNLAGNITAHVLGGTAFHPTAYKRAMEIEKMPEVKALLPPSVKQTLVGSFDDQTRYGFTGKNVAQSFPELGGKISGKRITEQTALGPMSATKPGTWTELSKKLTDPMAYAGNFLTKANDKMEKFFRSAMYLDSVEKIARKNFMEQVAKKGAVLDNFSVWEEMQKVMKDPKLAQKALDGVNDFMFDYNNLSQLERNVFRRAMPFYSFYSNMVKLAFFTLPAKYPIRNSALHGLARFGNQAWTEDLQSQGIDPKELPEWLRGSIPYNFDPETRTIHFISTQGPNIFQSASMDNILGNLHPIIKVGLERLLHQDLFRGKKFTSPDLAFDYAGNLRDMDGKIVKGVNPPIIEHILNQTPQWKALKDVVRYKQLGEIPLEYDTNSLLNPQPITDKSGRARSTKSGWQSGGAKMFGLPLTQIKYPETKGGKSPAAKGSATQIKRQKERLEKYMRERNQ